MENFEESIDKLIKKDSRVTSKRKIILEFLLKAKKPVSYFDIKKMLLERKMLADKTTIYRFFNVLKQQKIINEVNFADGIIRYELADRKHHHHIVCKKCNKVECIELSAGMIRQEEKQEKIIEKSNKFKIINHSLEFYGFCHLCQVKK